MDAFKWLTKNVNFSATFGKTIGGLIPGAGTIIGSLTDIFSAFSGAPSLGEMVMDGLNALSTQISELKSELTSVIEKTAEIQTARTVDFVLQGVDEIQQEVSAMQIMRSVSEQTALQELAIKKTEVYTQFLTDMEKINKSAYSDLKTIIDNCEADLQKLYNDILARFGVLGFEFFKYIEGLTAQASQKTSRNAPGIQETPGAAQEKKQSEGFNPLLLSPLLLLLFKKSKK